MAGEGVHQKLSRSDLLAPDNSRPLPPHRCGASAIEIGSDKGVGEHQDGHQNFTSDL
jgi:hypothetical protein